MLIRLLAIIGLTGLLSGAAAAQSAYDFTFDGIGGEPLALSQYSGKAMVVVNTASFCGFTNQYADLQQLWDDYRDEGLVVVGVPSDDFGQEADSAEEIKYFCETNFGINFPLTDQTRVTGAEAHPFYQWVQAEMGSKAMPRWNFHKYVIDRNGQLVASFPGAVTPTDAQLRSAVDEALASTPSS